jgi:Holliday junction resolvasome RuvABC DNA-binding subunit
MNNSLEIKDSSGSLQVSGVNPNGAIRLVVELSQSVPSFKNRKRAIPTKKGKYRTLTEPAVKKRMQEIESGILSALYSLCQTGSAATDSECRKQLRTVLSGLSDDSLNQIPMAFFKVEYGKQPAVKITIQKLK